MMQKIILLLLFVVLLNSGHAQKSFDLTEITNVYYLDAHTSSVTAENIFSKDLLFEKMDGSIHNFGLSRSSVWIKFLLPKTPSITDPILRISYPLLDSLDLFYVNDKGLKVKLSYSETSISSRLFSSPEYLISINNLNLDYEKEIFIRTQSTEQIILPISIIEKDELVSNLGRKNTFNGIYIGIVTIMILYNLFVFFSVKDKAYLIYVLYLLFMGLTQISIKGATFYIWGDSTWMKMHESTLLSSLGGLFTIVFAVEFLRLKKYFKTYVFLLLLAGSFLISIFFSLINEFFIAFSLMQIITTITTLTLFVVSFILAFTKQRSAIFFFVSWSFLLSGAVVFLLKDYSVIPFNSFTDSSMQIASSIEMSLLSFALADRINILKKEKDDAQKRELLVLQENQSLIENRNIELEQMVGARTLDLQKSNDELNDTLSKLQKAQVQLVESEKMVSLGQLTAGVAHEINNPINFVLSNVNPLRRDMEDLLDIINEYEAVKNNPDQGFSKVDDLKKSLDFDYLKEEIKQILEGIENGAERTSDIVKSLRMFSRLDESDQKKASISDCIESTLTVLTSKIKDFSVSINKDYQFTDEVNCFPGKLNQVFMNIINNSLDALENKSNAILSFSIKKIDDWLEIAISDNGIGMSENVKAHIFDPFFTTKEVGKGTGLGMSIVYSIIQDHHGKITVESEQGVGTTFNILLPITTN